MNTQGWIETMSTWMNSKSHLFILLVFQLYYIMCFICTVPLSRNFLELQKTVSLKIKKHFLRSQESQSKMSWVGFKASFCPWLIVNSGVFLYLTLLGWFGWTALFVVTDLNNEIAKTKSLCNIFTDITCMVSLKR